MKGLVDFTQIVTTVRFQDVDGTHLAKKVNASAMKNTMNSNSIISKLMTFSNIQKNAMTTYGFVKELIIKKLIRQD